jgi:hypothetical protein
MVPQAAEAQAAVSERIAAPVEAAQRTFGGHRSSALPVRG